jgi:hypothetical protein
MYIPRGKSFPQKNGRDQANQLKSSRLKTTAEVVIGSSFRREGQNSPGKPA